MKKRLTYTSVGLLINPGAAHPHGGISGGVQAASGVLLIFLGWLAASIALGFVWHRFTKNKWVWLVSPLIIIDLSVFIIAMFPIVGEFVKYGTFPAMAKPFFIYFLLLIGGILSSKYWYKYTNKNWVRHFVPWLVVPVILIAFPVVLLLTSKIT